MVLRGLLDGKSVAVFASLALLLALALPVSLSETNESGELPFELQRSLEGAMKAKIAEISKSTNAEGEKNKRGVYSIHFKKIDDATYQGTMQIDTADVAQMTTERMIVTLKEEGTGKKAKWKVTEQQVVDNYQGLKRASGHNCYPVDKFAISREGLEMSGGKGGVCEYYYGDTVSGFFFMGDKQKHRYVPPPHAEKLHIGHDFSALHDFVADEHSSELGFDPKVFHVRCDPERCERLLDESFTGLQRVPREQRSADSAGMPATIPPKLAKYFQDRINETLKDRREKPFSHFRVAYYPGRGYYDLNVIKNDDLKIGITYDSFEGYEVRFWVDQPGARPNAQGPGLPGLLDGVILGYYTAETLETTEPYELERRDDAASRWHDVYKIDGEVELGLDDPEMVEADINYGLTIKHDLDSLPFFIANIPRGENADHNKRPSLSVNSIQHNGEEITWVKTSAYGGRIIFPEVVPAGTKVDLSINFSTRAILKRNTAFSEMARFGWMPFVRFGDFIDDFKITVRVPSKFTVLGPGHKVWEKTEDRVRISRWENTSPVVFGTIIFGKYRSDTPSFDAKKLDGTVIPVTVHVDEVSMNVLKDADQLIATDTDRRGARLQESDINAAIDQNEMIRDLNSGARGIREKQLRPIAEQAANSINLYAELSGIDYPYGELNLVNDPAPALYGQAPSSLIYLGSMVFRGEGTASGEGFTAQILTGGGTGTAKFLKSVTAHEVGHQWWGSRVSNANGRNYWFVETLAEYFSGLYLEAVYGEKEYRQQVDEWRRNILKAELRSSVQNSSELWGGNDGFRSYQAAVYNKGPYAFHILRETFGDEKFFPFLKQFTQELVEKQEIVTLDIQRAAERALGGVDADGNAFNADLGWFFDQWIRGVGMPQYSFNYTQRETEDGGYILEGKINQRVIVGLSNNPKVLEGKFFRGFVDVTVLGKGGQEYTKRLVVQGPETEFRVKVPEKPLEVALNKYGEILAHDVLVNQSF